MVGAEFARIAPDVKLGENVKIYAFVNLYGCEIGNESKVGTFVEIQKGVHVGERVKISSHSFICEGVTIEDEVFIGHGVMFINDKYPRSTTEMGATSDGGGLGLYPNSCKKARLNWKQRNHLVWCDHRRRSHGGCRQCGHARCSARCGSSRQPCAHHQSKLISKKEEP